MNRVIWFTIALTIFPAAHVLGQANASENDSTAKPNILWLSVEDMGPHLGCYGDPVARTPNLDALAKRGMTYDLAWSNYPVCAPARTTLITGRYAASMGAGHMRCLMQGGDSPRFLSQLLQRNGYYCTNRSKQDYNIEVSEKGWDQSSGKATYRNRKKDQPFFAVFNYTGTHESRIRKRPHRAVTDPEKIVVPPYHPDTPEVRQDWAQYYDNIATMDQWVGDQLKKLEDNGLADSTIVIFFADHGSGMPRHKRYAGDSGMRVPLIVYVPRKFHNLAPTGYSASSRSDRPVGFVDFAPTMLSLAGQQPPSTMHGHAFMGHHKTPDPEFVFGFRSRMDERIDCSRSISDGRFVYIRNYMPHLPHGQFISYQQQTPTTAVWNRKYLDGELNAIQSYFWGSKDPEELYDLQSDPHETRNLVAGAKVEIDDEAQQALDRLRKALESKQCELDVEMIPEPLTARQSVSDLQNLERPDVLSEVVAMAREASDFKRPGTRSVDYFLDTLRRDDVSPAVRHWASVGVLIRGAQTNDRQNELQELLDDSLPTVRINVAETMMAHGNADRHSKALDVLFNAADMQQTDYHSAIWALNAIARLEDRAKPILPKLEQLPRRQDGPKRGGDYVERLLKDLGATK